MEVQYARPSVKSFVTSSASHFVGRQREMSSIKKQYEAAKSGDTRVALLVGELGIGKTRLLDEFAEYAIRDGATVLRGGTSESEGMPPYLPFLEALGQYIRSIPSNKLPEQIAMAPQILAGILPELSSRLGEITTTYSLLPEQARLRLYEAVGLFLEAISVPHVLVLTLDDLHWADASSLDLLYYITRHHSKTKLLVVGTYREGESDGNPALERTVTELARQRVLTQIALEPLSADESEELAASYLEGSISPTFSQLLYTQSEGNPFFAEELLQGWIEMGALIQDDKHRIAVALLEYTLPSSIVGALRQRFARLSPDVIDHLRIAAIIGRTFDLSLLATVEGREAEGIEERLLEAEHARLVTTDQTGMFKFSHDKIRECLYAEVSASRRQRLHNAIGQTLEVRYEKEQTKSIYQLAELAFHFTQSGDRIRGVTYSQLAAELALQSSASKEGVRHYQNALKLLEPSDDRYGTLLLGLGEAALLAGDINEATGAYETALLWLLQAGDQHAAARAAYNLGLVQWRQEAVKAARVAFEHALTLLGNTISAEVVGILVDLSLLLSVYMELQTEGAAYAQQAMEMAHLLKDKNLEIAASRVVAVNVYVSGNDTAAIGSLEQTLILADAYGNSSEAAECCMYLMVMCYCMAEIGRSNEVNLRGIEFVKRCQQQPQLPYVLSWQAFLFASQGMWAKAEQMLDHTLTFVDYQESSISLAFLHRTKGFLAYQQEDFELAEQEFQAAKESQHRGPGGLIYYANMLGMVQIALGKREDAYTTLHDLEALLAKSPTDALSAAPILTCLALMAIALDDQERVAKLYPSLLPFHGRQYGFLVDRVLGEMAILRRDWATAMIHLSTAEATAQREGLRPELARVLLRMAEVVAHDGRDGDTRAKDLLNHSLILFEKMNMTDSAEHVRRLLRTLLYRLDSSSLRSLPAGLTMREVKLLQLIVKGRSNRQIANELGISEKTVANHLSHIFNKTTSDNRAAAAAFAIRHGLA